MKHLVAAVAAFTLIWALDAAAVPRGKPLPEPKKEAKAPLPIPNLEELLGTSNWGDVTQQGRRFEINEHPQWYAVGEIRDDGSVLVIWTLRASERVAPGVYKVAGKELVGSWGFAEDVTIEKDGSLSGSVREDRVYRLPAAAVPEIQ